MDKLRHYLLRLLNRESTLGYTSGSAVERRIDLKWSALMKIVFEQELFTILENMIYGEKVRN